MIRSMTGFGHGEVSNDKNQKVTVEMKSVNHRYCDISLKLPKKLAMFEANIRNIMKEYASRGKIDIYVSYEDLSETAVSLHYNQAMAEEYMQVFKKMQEDFNIDGLYKSLVNAGLSLNLIRKNNLKFSKELFFSYFVSSPCYKNANIVYVQVFLAGLFNKI